MTEPCMFPNLHEPFYCRIHADVRLRLTDERCRAGVILTQPQPDTGLREAASRLVRSVNVLAAWDEAHGYIVNSHRDALANDEDAAWEEVRAALRSTPAAPSCKHPDIEMVRGGARCLSCGVVEATPAAPQPDARPTGDTAHPRYRREAAHEGGGMVPDPSGQWVHVQDLGVTEWSLDALDASPSTPDEEATR